MRTKNIKKNKKPDFTILIPAWNEEDIIRDSVRKIMSYFKNKNFEFLIVDDGSTDKTPSILKELAKKYSKLRVLTHKKNMGMGAALQTGFKNANSPVIITMDADLTHPLSLVSKMLYWINKGYDVVIASRYVRGGGFRDIPKWRQLISIIGNKIFRAVFWSNIHDMTTGYRAYRTEAAKKINLKSRKFESQLEISVKILKKRIKFKEIPLVLGLRKKGTSKFNYIKAFKTYVPTIIRLFFYKWFGRG